MRAALDIDGTNAPDLRTASPNRSDTFVAFGAIGMLAISVLATGCPGWVAMWAMAAGLYAIAKWLTWRPMRHLNLPVTHAAAYLVGWPGLDAREFLRPRVAPQPPRQGEWAFAAAKLLLGLALLRFAIATATDGNVIAAGWSGLTAIAFTLHFGSFHLLSCLWRRHGFGAMPVMDWPILASSVSEFWGRRWNRPVNDGTYQFVFKPMARTFGVKAASLLAFLFSGGIHELLVTIPARANWGSPTLYFLIQGLALHLERSPLGRRLGIDRGWGGWLYTAIATAVPAGFLFPPAFMQNVIVPFLRALSASS